MFLSSWLDGVTEPLAGCCGVVGSKVCVCSSRQGLALGLTCLHPAGTGSLGASQASVSGQKSVLILVVLISGAELQISESTDRMCFPNDPACLWVCPPRAQSLGLLCYMFFFFSSHTCIWSTAGLYPGLRRRQACFGSQ